MKRLHLAAAFLLAAAGGSLAGGQAAPPAAGAVPAAVPLDARVQATLKARGTELLPRCSDEVFIRRVYVDVIGTLPDPQVVRTFLEDTSPGKRAALIETLFGRGEFADYWALRWGDLLRIKSEFPINLWPNAVQAYHGWVRNAIRDNMPYDQFARALLTSSGSNFRTPPVNFYRAIQGREPATIAGAVALTFMGTRLESLPQARRAGMTALFSRVAYKKSGEWKEEIVYLDPSATTPLKAALPDGTNVQVPADQDPRGVFATWLVAPGNPWFARSIVNRIWSWLMGRGIINEPDDIRPDNPPASPELLAYLEKELVASHYDLRHIYRLILNSATYQQSSVMPGLPPDARTLFARYTVRRLDAEVLIDALCWIGGDGESYSSPIPEPFTFIPSSRRTIALADGSITSQFLETFGRPARDTGLCSERNNQPSDAQRLYLLNSTEFQRRIEHSPRLGKLATEAKGSRPDLIRGIYLTLLSRYPAPEELAVAEKHFQTAGLTQKQAADDLAWALVNTKEFLYRH